MNGQYNRNGKKQLYRDPPQTPYRRDSLSRSNDRSPGSPRPVGQRPSTVGAPGNRTAGKAQQNRPAGRVRGNRSSGQASQIPTRRNHEPVPPHGSSMRYPAARFGATADTSIFQRSWFRIWMLVLVLIAIVAIVAVAVSSSRSKGEERDNDSYMMMTAASGAAETDAPKADDGLFRAFADESTADMAADIDSGYGVLIDVAQGKIIASKGAYDKINPASMTKLMTLIVAYENIDDLTGYFEMTSSIIDPVYTSDASLAGFSPGETVLIKDLFYGAALPSGADATSALAILAAGDEDSFAVMMNEKARSLGLKDTHFENASGLHGNNHYSTCYDMAIILKCAMDNEFLREVISTYQYTTASTAKHPEGVKLENTMLSRMRGDEAPGFTIIGGKTGYTPNAGHCLASFGKRNSDGAQYILVTAKGADRYTPVYDAIDVYGKYATAEGRTAVAAP